MFIMSCRSVDSLVLEVDATNADDIVLVCRVVQRAIQRPVIADC